MKYENIEVSGNARLLIEQAGVSEGAVKEFVEESAKSDTIEHFDGTAIADGPIGEIEQMRVVISETSSEGPGTDALVIATAVLPS